MMLLHKLCSSLKKDNGLLQTKINHLQILKILLFKMDQMIKTHLQILTYQQSKL